MGGAPCRTRPARPGSATGRSTALDEGRHATALRLLIAGSAAHRALGQHCLHAAAVTADTEHALARLGTRGPEVAASVADLTGDAAVELARRGRGARGRRPARGWAGLTPAERRVATLVAEGLSNPEIATRMFVSRATVKTHLAHAFTKLGVTGRAQLAAEVTRSTQSGSA